MRYYYKKPGAWTWAQYETDSLEADVAAGSIGTDWRIHREGESTQYLASELIAVEAAAKDQRPQQKEKVPADIGKSAAAAEPFLRTTKMQKTRPLAVTLIAIWLFLAGSLIIFGGLSLLLEYANAIQRSETDSLVNSWLPYFRFYGGVGVLWVLAGLGLCISTFGLWSGSAWGRILDLLCYAGVVVGWVIIWFVSPSGALDLFDCSVADVLSVCRENAQLLHGRKMMIAYCHDNQRRCIFFSLEYPHEIRQARADRFRDVGNARAARSCEVASTFQSSSHSVSDAA